jgi:hypothetical protein
MSSIYGLIYGWSVERINQLPFVVDVPCKGVLESASGRLNRLGITEVTVSPDNSAPLIFPTMCLSQSEEKLCFLTS